MTPMIDVVFLLLVFFVWTSSFQAAEQLLPGRVSQKAGSRATNVNTPPPPPQDDFDEMVIRVVGEGDAVAYLLNDQPVAGLAELRERLAAIVSIEDAAPVIIDPDPEAGLGAAMDAYDTALLAGATEVAFSAPAAALEPTR